MYCPKELHDNKTQHKTLEELKNIWYDIVKKTENNYNEYQISFTGGEITTNKDFILFAEWLKAQPQETYLQVTSNGSADLSYYKKLLNYINGLSLSLHSEHVNEQKFFEKAIALHKNCFMTKKDFHVNIMNEFWNQERIPKYEKILSRYHIPYSVNDVGYNYKTREIPIFKGKLNLE